MSVYRKQIIIQDPARLVLSDLPFSPGERVEIQIESESLPKTEAAHEWKALFEQIDKSPDVRRISEEEIAAEIAAYRAGK